MSTVTNAPQRLLYLLTLLQVGCLSGSFFAVAKGASNALTVQHVGAGLLFGVTLLGWYIFLALVLQAVDFPFSLPLGDLSTRIPGPEGSG